MSGLGGFLLALGLADLISGGMAGETENRLRSTVGAVAAGWIAAWTAWMLGLATANSWLYIGIVLATSACWISLRMLAERTPRIGILALLVLGMGILATVTLAGRWAGTLPLLDRWLAETPITVLQAWTSDRWLLFVGLLAFLTATSNAIVRSILRATGTEFDRSRRRLRGGGSSVSWNDG